MAASEIPHPDPAHAAASEQAEWRGLKGDVEGIADVAAERGRGLMDAARLQAQTFVEGRKNDAAQSVHDLAKTLRDSSKDFEDRPNIKAFFDSAADGLSQLGGSIESRSFADFYGEAEAFARRAPVAVAVGTFVAGFIAARFIKSSSLPPEGDARDSFRA
ncbi:hypothetical protein AFCDBAGC_1071 [Methylobacterium cerastii]|uniref:Uncharacterized protein n=1 Tax=Methylobacterium cerastii TaxID=932741 RepID=A0ABQ4QE98_9HYPH|nr:MULTISPECIES: hypothetical protein [Methylobacterium]TXN13683.1 hypothetical protein FV219_04625 [Methylobacterium sp. WL122]TXM66760.1 hypothetical protein FV229_11970 [Methylobacterium sp. WL120]TXM71434.1 hypothetical protein FV226_15345 [Methylobacterium sp. WL12]TXN01122.1 hypothetical protein FV222_11045 [Methylobacterium sp. WL103]TXN82204.1 hypothetical protein FV234_10865 [Methylobacterium sp. WL8]